MTGYEEYSDEELILRFRDGDSSVMDYIMEKYKELVRKKAKSMYLLGADNDDLIQEGMIGLFKAVRDYDAGRDASFYTFADLCVSRQMYTAVQASNRQKHAPLNRYISLSRADGGDEGAREAGIALKFPDLWEKSPEEYLIDRENLHILERTIEKELSGFEYQVLELYLTGMGYGQIARVLGRDEKSTDNALQRIKTKLRRALDKKKAQESGI